MNDLTADKLYYVKKKNGDVCIRQAHLFSTLKTEKAMSFVDFDDDDILAVLAPVPTYGQFVDVSKKVEELKQQLEYAERTLKNIRILMTCDPSDMKEIDENFCANQLALETVNGYFEKYGAEK